MSHVGFVSGASQRAWYGSTVANGITGVTVFFVLSGFLLYRPFLAAELDGARPIALRDYARRRLLRILPAYWLALTIIAIWLDLPGVFTHDWWRYYFLLQVYTPHTVAGGLVQAWTLCVELSFYLLLPLYAIALGRIARGRSRTFRLRLDLAVLVVLAAGSLTMRYFTLTGHFAHLYTTLIPNFNWFAVGMAVAIVSVGPIGAGLAQAVGAHPVRSWAVAAATYVVLAIALHTPADQPLFYSTRQWMAQQILSVVVAVALVAPAVFGDQARGWPRRVLANRTLGYLGLISYGIYLWQSAWSEQAARWVQRLNPPHSIPSFLVVLVPAVVLSIACAAVSYRFLEQPLMRFKNQRPASGPPATPDTAAAPASGRAPVPGSGPGSPR